MLSIITILSIWFTWSVYNSREALKEQSLFRHGQQISKELSSTFDYVTNLLTFFGEQIRDNNPNDLKSIATLLQGRLINNNIIREQFSWAMFDWSTPDKQMAVSTAWGIMGKSKNISHRYYAQQAFIEPWKLHFDEKDVGISSGQVIIPAGMGIIAKDGEPLGILSLGFDVDRIIRRIEQIVNKEEISFLVLDRNHNIILQSADNIPVTIKENFFQQSLPFPLNMDYGKLVKPIEYGDIRYLHYNKAGRYPFIILVGYNKHVFNQGIQEVLLPGIVGYISIGITSLSLLLLLRFLIIKPIMELSKSADKIAKGDVNVRIPGKGSKEIFSLAKQLVSIKYYIRKIHWIERDLIIARQQAEEASKAKSRFLAHMSHELRTPLVAINGFSEAMALQIYGPLNERYIEASRDIHKTGLHLLNLINELLDSSKIEAGQMHLLPEPCDVKELLHESAAVIAAQAARKGLTLELHCAESLPPLICDRMRMKQVLLNLLSNAIKFTPEGGKIALSASLEHDEYVLQVADTGIGIAESNLPLVLNEFTQVRDTYIHYEGTGLGLPIAKQFVELHQGKFIITSTLGKGTTITLRFPHAMPLNGEQAEEAYAVAY